MWVRFTTLHGPTSYNEDGQWLGQGAIFWGGMMGFAAGVESSPEVEALLIRRRDARAAKDFKASDQIRDQLAAIGYAIKDMAGGKVEVKRKS